MPRVLLAIVIVSLTIYCIVEVAQARNGQVRAMPKWLWAFTVICLPVLGPVTWLFFGRPVSGHVHRPLPPKAPDDDEDFLRGLR
ncbi:PLD nuclease N-terminal domain-containing protein [Tessaracoccus defluvii]|uniref:PLD nuclease N-terminal domain-containing protein n=1 Tax=Tessaracoccus defluvii TaxID=1285901 RepID=UPI0031D8ACBE